MRKSRRRAGKQRAKNVQTDTQPVRKRLSPRLLNIKEISCSAPDPTPFWILIGQNALILFSLTVDLTGHKKNPGLH